MMSEFRDAFKIAIVGAGMWGKNHVRVFCDLLGTSNVAVVDSSDKVLKEMSNLFEGVAIFRELSMVLNDDAYKAVVIATPPSSHFKLAMQGFI